MLKDVIVCVIPTHDRDASLVVAIRSIEAQSLKPISVIVVDDLGSQSTRHVVESQLWTVPVRYVDGSTIPTKSAGASRNLGVANAPGCDYFAFLDDDDYWKPDFLLRSIERHHKGDVDLVASWGAMASGDRVVDHAWKPWEGAAASEILARNPGITGSNFLICQPAYAATGGFDADQWVFNDLEFLVRFLDHGFRYAVVPEDLVVQTVQPGSHLSSRGARRAAGIERYIRLHTDRLTKRQRRVLSRQAAVAHLYPEQTRRNRLRFTIIAIINSAPGDVLSFLCHRLRRNPSYR